MLERLLRREKPENILYGTVLQIDSSNKRVKIRGPNDIELWAGYLPEDFQDLKGGHTVAIAKSGSSAFLVRRLAPALPTSMVILEV
jgi:hypothetical protein